MKSLIVTAVVAWATLSPAMASHYNIAFHDTLRPNGHHRSLAVAKAASASCFTQTGTSPEATPTQAYKDCMKAQGFRWMATKLIKDRRPNKRPPESRRDTLLTMIRGCSATTAAVQRSASRRQPT